MQLKPDRRSEVSARRKEASPSEPGETEDVARQTGVGALVRRFTHLDGVFLLERLRPGRYVLEVSAHGFLPARMDVTVAGGEALEDLEIRLRERAE